MAQITEQAKYKDDAVKYFDYLVDRAQKTPKGLLWLSQWGSNRYAANAAFLMMQSKQMNRLSEQQQQTYFDFAQGRVKT